MQAAMAHLNCQKGLLLILQDDSIGAEFPVCESDFNGPDSEDNLVRWYAETEFDAVLFCGDCKLPSPPPPVVEGAVTSFAAVSLAWIK